MGHLLQKDKPGEHPAASNGSADSAGAPPSENAMPKDFMDRVTRLLALMETQKTASDPAQQGANISGSASTPAAPGDTAVLARSKPRRTRKKVVSAPTPEALLRKFRLALQKHLKARMGQIPNWESLRGMQDPDEFFCSRLLAKDVLCDLSADLLRATGIPAGSLGALRCPSSLVPLDSLLRHLHAGNVTGELRVETEEETVLLFYEQGQVILITSNHPRNYCAGTACDFTTVPHAVIGEAVSAQQQDFVPFFVSLKNAGHLPGTASLEALLRNHGQGCLRRAFKWGQSVAVFTPLARLSATARSCKTDFPLNQLLLVCYRTVDDWFTLEKLFPDMETVLLPSSEIESQISELLLEPEESRLLQALHLGGTVPEAAEAVGLTAFETCRILFRFIKLGFVRQGPHRSHDPRVDEEVPAKETSEILPTAEPDPANAGPMGEIASPPDTSANELTRPGPLAASSDEAAPVVPPPAPASPLTFETPSVAVASENESGDAPSAVPSPLSEPAYQTT